MLHDNQVLLVANGEVGERLHNPKKETQMTDVVTSLKVVDQRLVDELSIAICEILDQAPDEIVLPALADVVATCCNIADKNNPETLLDTLYNRACGQFHAVYVRRAAPKPDSVTPFVRPDEETQ
jgi:hypothetical protein